MMLPILISLSLAPGSYFFCAAAGYIPTKMLTTRDASTTPRDRFISPSPDIAGCSPIMRQSRVQALNLSSHETGQRAVLLAAHVTFLEYPGDERTRSAARSLQEIYGWSNWAFIEGYHQFAICIWPSPVSRSKKPTKSQSKSAAFGAAAGQGGSWSRSAHTHGRQPRGQNIVISQERSPLELAAGNGTNY